MLCFRCGSHNPDGSEFCSQCGQKFVEKKAPPPKDPTDPELSSTSEDEKLLEVGTQVADRYEVRALLGTGPVGAVYRVHDLEIDVDVAMKSLSPRLLQTREERKRFLAEIRSVRKIKHPNVVRHYDEDQDGDLVFFTMQMLEGLSLRKIIELRKGKNQPFAGAEIIPIFSHTCQALDEAHESTTHGDLKPENIIVLPDMLKVTDFGLLQSLPHRPFVAAQKNAKGAGAYLAPELREDASSIDPAADIYSLAVILCEMLTGEVYRGPESSLPGLPNEFSKLTSLLKKALNENPAKRFTTPRALFEELHSLTLGSKPKLAKPPRPAPKRAGKGGPKKSTPSKPPRAAPSRKNVSFGVGNATDPPTVVNAEIQPDAPPAAQGKLAKTTDVAEAIENLAGEVEPEESGVISEIVETDLEDASEGDDGLDGAIQDLDEDEYETLDEDDLDEDELDEDDFDEDIDSTPEDDEETLVATPLTPVNPDPDLRVARPKNQSQPPSDQDDVAARLEDHPEKVEVLSARKRQDTVPLQQNMQSQPPISSPTVEVAPQTPVGKQPQPAVAQPTYPPGYQPSYPPGYQPSYPPGMYSQPPPAPSRLPVYIFLSVITVIVGVGVYFLVDYLIAAKRQLTGVQPDVASIAPVTPPKPDALVSKPVTDDKPVIGPAKSDPKEVKPGEAGKAAAMTDEERKAAERKRVEDYLKAEDARKAELARLAAQKKKEEDDRKREEARLAAMKKKTSESSRAFEVRKAAERRKVEARRKAAERRKAEKARKAAEARKAEDARKAEQARKADEARKAEEARLAEERRKAAAKKPMLEEVPLPADAKKTTVGTKPADPKGSPLADMPTKKEVAKLIEPKVVPPAETPKKGNCPRGMVHIGEGKAYVGSATNDPMRNFGEKKLHQVEVNAFCIDRYEYPNASGKTPRVSVSWKQAEKLCRKRGKRLCSEDEWEFACKGKGNRSFPYGKNWDPNRCNTEDAEGNDRQVGNAGAFKGCRSPFGVLDMSGNVSEWTASKYQPSAAARTYKGGSATRPNWATRCATRSSLSPAAKKADLGFRCCAKSK